MRGVCMHVIQEWLTRLRPIRPLIAAAPCQTWERCGACASLRTLASAKRLNREDGTELSASTCGSRDQRRCVWCLMMV